MRNVLQWRQAVTFVPSNGMQVIVEGTVYIQEITIPIMYVNEMKQDGLGDFICF